PAQVLRNVLTGHYVRETVRKMRAAEDPAGGRLQGRLRTLEYLHVVGLASGVENARDHRDQKHSSDGLDVRGFWRAEITHKPIFNASCAIPFQDFEMIAHRMEFAFAAAHVHGGVHSIGTEVLQARTLQELLQSKDVGVFDGSRLDWPPFLLHEHRGALHFIVGERLHEGWIVAERNQYVGKD